MSEYRDLGMHRRIPRRDFLNGVALGLTGFGIRDAGFHVLASQFQVPSSSARTAAYPPALTGLRGNDPAAVAAFRAVQQGAYRQFPSPRVGTPQGYDLLLVGAGSSRLGPGPLLR